MEKWSHPILSELRPLDGVERGRLLLEVPAGLIDVPFAITRYADRNEFTSKEEYHVTVVGKKTQERLLAEGMLDKVSELLEQTPQWSVVSLDDILLLRNFETDDSGDQVIEESIIQLVTLSGLNAIYDEIRETTGLSISTPPAHITLFTKNADRGIGLYSNEQLTEYTVKKLV